jgi:hypothetical protein
MGLPTQVAEIQVAEIRWNLPFESIGSPNQRVGLELVE